ncbi:hypothetical protein CR513_19628, partial [Mucuna pruriens]
MPFGLTNVLFTFQCQFERFNVEYLGHVISGEGVAMGHAKFQGEVLNMTFDELISKRCFDEDKAKDKDFKQPKAHI